MYYPEISTPSYQEIKIKVDMEQRQALSCHGKACPVKIAWIIRQKQNGISNDAIASTMKISEVWVKKLWARYRKEGIIYS